MSLTSSQTQKRIKVEIILYGVSKALPGLISMLTVIVFAKLLGLESFGKYALYSSIVFTASTLGVGWWNQAVLRFESNIKPDEHSHANLLGNFRRIILCCITFFSAIAACVITWFSDQEDESALIALLVIGVAAGAYAWLVAEKAYQQARFRPGVIVVIDVIRTGGLLAIGAIGIWIFNASYVFAIACIAISSFLAVLVSRGMPGKSRRDLSHASKSEFTSNVLFSYFRYGWPLGLWIAAMTSMQVVDRGMLGQAMGNEAVGIYSALYELIVKGYSVVVYPVTLALHPHIMSMANSGKKNEISGLIIKGLQMQLIVIVILSIAMYVAGEELMAYVINLEHPDIMPTMLVLLLGSGLWQIALLVHKPMEYQNKTFLMLFAMILALAMNITCNYTMIPLWGILGAAWAMVLSSATYIMLVVSYIYLRNAYEAAI